MDIRILKSGRVVVKNADQWAAKFRECAEAAQRFGDEVGATAEEVERLAITITQLQGVFDGLNERAQEVKHRLSEKRETTAKTTTSAGAESFEIRHGDVDPLDVDDPSLSRR